MSARHATVIKAAQDYYNSDDADSFYYHIWGRRGHTHRHL
jgi:hypothetical protein